MFDANLNQVFSEEKQEVMKPFWDPERSRKFFWKAKRIQPFVDSITSFAISLASGALLHGSLVSGAPVIDVLCASSLTSGLLNAA